VVRDPDTGKLNAVKYISSSNLDKGSFIQEVESLARLNHPCVFRTVHWALPNRWHCAEIHTEYAERGSLEDFESGGKSPVENTFWTGTKTAILICDIVLGLRFVHFRDIIHRDVKPSNILIRHNGRALIGDFGSSRFRNDDATVSGQSGTVHYAAPELFNEDSEMTAKVDVWGFGLILYEIVAHCAVFPISLSPFDVIRQMRLQFRPVIPSECGDYMKDLICRCWSDDPNSRPSFDEILREFQAREFSILPDVDCEKIRCAVEGVLEWELKAGVSHELT
jgi:serine/threonine protein kinase